MTFLAQSLKLTTRATLPVFLSLAFALFAWIIAEYSTLYFQYKIDSELQKTTSSDIEVSTRIFPTNEQREILQNFANKQGMRFVETLVFPFSIDTSAQSLGVIQADVRIVQDGYPLRGEFSYSGSFSGALVQSEMYPILKKTGIEIAGKMIPVTGEVYLTPDASNNPFAQNRTILIPESLLRFSDVAGTGSLFRYEYEAGILVGTGVDTTKTAALLRKELGLPGLSSGENAGESSEQVEQGEQGEQWAAGQGIRVRVQGGAGGNMNEIADAVNIFLGTILFSATGIATVVFFVGLLSFSRKRQTVSYLLFRLGVPLSSIIRAYSIRLLIPFICIAIVLGVLWIFTPTIITYFTQEYFPSVELSQGIKFLPFVLLLLTGGFWLVAEMVFSQFGYNQKRLRIFSIAVISVLAGVYFLLDSTSNMPFLYAIIAVIVIERGITGLFAIIPSIISKLRLSKELYFNCIDSVRTYRFSPILGKISFVLFFVISLVFSLVALFTLSLKEALTQIVNSPLDAYVMNLTKNDFARLQNWNSLDDFHSVIRARITKINTVSLNDHLGESVPSRRFTREFNITDTPTAAKIIDGRAATKPNEVTVDLEFAEDINLSIGDVVSFGLAGREFDFVVVGMRDSKRSGISPFFYFQIPFDSIEGAPKTYFLVADTGELSLDEWKKKILADSGNHVTFIDIRSIIEQASTYAEMVLVGVASLFFYITIISALAFVVSESTFVQSKLQKLQVYRLFGTTQKRAKSLLFIDSIFGSILPVFVGILAGSVVFGVLIFQSSLLTIHILDIVILLVIVIFVLVISYFFLSQYANKKIEATNPKIGDTNQ